MSYTYSSRPLLWQEFQGLMREMNKTIADTGDIHRKKYAKIQTLIAIGAYLGPLAMELLSIKWYQVKDFGAYFFVNESYRQPLVIGKALKSIVDRNYKVINPLSNQAYVMGENTGLTEKAIAPRRFTTILKNVFNEYGIDIPAASNATLRRTFARKVWTDDKQSKDILEELAVELRLYIGSVEKYVQA
ncbi:MAG: hypothetical protein AAF519_06270 [Bacteroidota bacterium]